jgi:hypothetical protein
MQVPATASSRLRAGEIEPAQPECRRGGAGGVCALCTVCSLSRFHKYCHVVSAAMCRRSFHPSTQRSRAGDPGFFPPQHAKVACRGPRVLWRNARVECHSFAYTICENAVPASAARGEVCTLCALCALSPKSPRIGGFGLSDWEPEGGRASRPGREVAGNKPEGA